jgi:hypothetical protein
MSAVSNADEAIARVNRCLAAEKEGTELEGEILEGAVVFGVDPSCADIAIAAPELPEIVAARLVTPHEKVKDVVLAQIAAIFRDQPMPF